MRTLPQKTRLSRLVVVVVHVLLQIFTRRRRRTRKTCMPPIRRRLTMGVGRSRRRIVSTIISTHSSHGRRKERKGGREHVYLDRANGRIERAIVCNALKRIRRCCYSRGREGNKKAGRDGNLGRIYTFLPPISSFFANPFYPSRN